MADDFVTEDQCSVCSVWPAAERALRRREHFSTDYIEMPFGGVCDQCQSTFWQAICVVAQSPEEFEALQQTLRQERRKGFFDVPLKCYGQPDEALAAPSIERAAPSWAAQVSWEGNSEEGPGAFDLRLIQGDGNYPIVEHPASAYRRVTRKSPKITRQWKRRANFPLDPLLG